jgi:hypothetical protein
MTTLPIILVTILVAAVVIPLALLLIFMIADALGLPFADTILGVAVHAIIVEFAIGSVVNLVGGIAIAALGIWGSLHFGGLPHGLLSLILIPVGFGGYGEAR